MQSHPIIMRTSRRQPIFVFALLISFGKIQGAPETKLNLLPADCGSSDAGNVKNEVVKNPWMAILRYNTSSGIMDACIGTLINARYVLTAGHCISRSGRQPNTIILGEYDKARNPDCYQKQGSAGIELDPTCVETEEYGVESIQVHPDYDQRKHRNDIGLIRLDRDVMMKDHIRAICLPVTSALREESAESYVVTTWKVNIDAPPTCSNTLREVTVRRVNNPDCEQKVTKINNNIKISERQICTEGSDQICRGIAGAPLGNSISHNGVRFVQYGIVSFGSTQCEETDIPEVCTRVASYMEWILDTIVP